MHSFPITLKPTLCKQDILDYLKVVSPTTRSTGYYIARNTIPTAIVVGLIARGSQRLLDIAYQTGYIEKELAVRFVKWFYPSGEAYVNFPINMGLLGAAAVTVYTLYKKHLRPSQQTEMIKQKLAHLDALMPITERRLKEISDHSGIDLLKALNERFATAREKIVDTPESISDGNRIDPFIFQSLENMFGEIMGKYPNFSDIYYRYKDVIDDDLIEHHLIRKVTIENKDDLRRFALISNLEVLKDYCESR